MPYDCRKSCQCVKSVTVFSFNCVRQLNLSLVHLCYFICKKTEMLLSFLFYIGLRFLVVNKKLCIYYSLFSTNTLEYNTATLSSCMLHPKLRVFRTLKFAVLKAAVNVNITGTVDG
jgi:hypothetical protein